LITEPGDMTIQVLGPLTVRLNQVPIMPCAAKPRQVLALLALNAGRLVTVSTLLEELWGDHPPVSALTTLQTYVLASRRRMAAAMGPGRDPKGVLHTRHDGYQLDTQASQIDVKRFGQLAQSGRAAAEKGDHPTAAELLERALELWRGPALVDIRKGRVLELEAMALEEARISVLSRRIEADLALGRHADILGELTTLTATHPLNENFAAQLITALYRTGHVARSLQEYHRLRIALVDELGIEPSPRLQQLQQAVLSGDPSLAAAEPAFRQRPALVRHSCTLLPHRRRRSSAPPARADGCALGPLSQR
jgi:SARP family transcriptional regulator, regulator of embCAB operon